MEENVTAQELDRYSFAAHRYEVWQCIKGYPVSVVTESIYVLQVKISTITKPEDRARLIVSMALAENGQILADSRSAGLIALREEQPGTTTAVLWADDSADCWTFQNGSDDSWAAFALMLLPKWWYASIPGWVTTLENTRSEEPHQAFASGNGQKGTKRRRGGPIGHSENEKLEYIEGWHRASKDEGIPQEVYCARKGIGASTLRSWMRELEAAGKLAPS